MKLGKLAKSTLLKDFPDKWVTLARMLDLEYQVSEHGDLIELNVNNDELYIAKTGKVTTSVKLNDELIYELIIALKEQNK